MPKGVKGTLKFTKVVPVKVEPEKWAAFCLACQKYGKPPADVLRELIDHVDAAVTAIRTQQIVMLDGDLSSFMARRFPAFNPAQWRFIAGMMAEIADLVEGVPGERG